MTHKAIEAKKKLSQENIEVSLYDVINIKPLSDNLIKEINSYKKIITIEEQTLNGGFGSIIINGLMKNGISNKKIKCLGLDNKYYFQNGGREFLLNESGLSAENILKTVKNL